MPSEPSNRRSPLQGSDSPAPQIHWACDGCGRAADWTGFRKFCGACGSRERTAWLFKPLRPSA